MDKKIQTYKDKNHKLHSLINHYRDESHKLLKLQDDNQYYAVSNFHIQNYFTNIKYKSLNMQRTLSKTHSIES